MPSDKRKALRRRLALWLFWLVMTPLLALAAFGTLLDAWRSLP